VTDPQALELARRIASCWRGSTPVAEWVPELALLDHTPAVATFERLRRVLEDPGPSVRRFLSEYRAIVAPAVVEAWREPLGEPRKSRDEILAILRASGAPEKFIPKRKETA
jgi:hypothetical protein